MKSPLPCRPENLRCIQFLLCPTRQFIQVEFWMISQQTLIRTIRRIYTCPSLIHQFATASANPETVNAVLQNDIFQQIPLAKLCHKKQSHAYRMIHCSILHRASPNVLSASLMVKGSKFQSRECMNFCV